MTSKKQPKQYSMKPQGKANRKRHNISGFRQFTAEDKKKVSGGTHNKKKPVYFRRDLYLAIKAIADEKYQKLMFDILTKTEDEVAAAVANTRLPLYERTVLTIFYEAYKQKSLIGLAFFMDRLHGKVRTGEFYITQGTRTSQAPQGGESPQASVVVTIPSNGREVPENVLHAQHEANDRSSEYVPRMSLEEIREAIKANNPLHKDATEIIESDEVIPDTVDVEPLHSAQNDEADFTDHDDEASE